MRIIERINRDTSNIKISSSESSFRDIFNPERDKALRKEQELLKSSTRVDEKTMTRRFTI